MIEPRRRSWPDISSCNSTTAINNNNNNLTTPINDSTSPTTRPSIDSHTPWSLNSLKFHIPSSPSPNCSSFTPSSSPSPSSSPLSDFFYSQISPSVFSSPRYHHNNTKASHASSSSDQEEHVLEQEEEEESVLESFFKEDEEDVKEVNATNAQRVSYSTEYKSVVDNDAGLIPLQIPEEVVEEEGTSKRRSSKTEETVRWRRRRRSGKEEEVMKWPPVDAHQALINRPKPFGVFLEEIKKREFDGEVDAWKEDQNLKLMDKLQRKEDDIHKWELKQTRIATMRMKKIECKWERKRAKALERLQKKIEYVQEEAEAKKVRERRSTVDELSRVSIAEEKMKANRSRSHLKFFCIF